MPGTPRAGIIPVTPFQQNCTLIWDDATKVGAVIDPGGDLDRIEAAIAEQGVKVEKDSPHPWPCRPRGRGGRVAREARRADRGPAPRRQVPPRFPADDGGAVPDRPGPGRDPDRWLDGGDVVQVGELTFDILHCPATRRAAWCS